MESDSNENTCTPASRLRIVSEERNVFNHNVNLVKQVEDQGTQIPDFYVPTDCASSYTSTHHINRYIVRQGQQSKSSGQKMSSISR